MSVQVSNARLRPLSASSIVALAGRPGRFRPVPNAPSFRPFRLLGGTLVSSLSDYLFRKAPIGEMNCSEVGGRNGAMLLNRSDRS